MARANDTFNDVTEYDENYMQSDRYKKATSAQKGLYTKHMRALKAEQIESQKLSKAAKTDSKNTGKKAVTKGTSATKKRTRPAKSQSPDDGSGDTTRSKKERKKDSAASPPSDDSVGPVPRSRKQGSTEELHESDEEKWRINPEAFGKNPSHVIEAPAPPRLTGNIGPTFTQDQRRSLRRQRLDNIPLCLVENAPEGTAGVALGVGQQFSDLEQSSSIVDNTLTSTQVGRLVDFNKSTPDPNAPTRAIGQSGLQQPSSGSQPPMSQSVPSPTTQTPSRQSPSQQSSSSVTAKFEEAKAARKQHTDGWHANIKATKKAISKATKERDAAQAQHDAVRGMVVGLPQGTISKLTGDGNQAHKVVEHGVGLMTNATDPTAVTPDSPDAPDAPDAPGGTADAAVFTGTDVLPDRSSGDEGSENLDDLAPPPIPPA